VVICPVGYDRSEAVKAAADQLYADLQTKGVDVILDDRGERPGAMFADWELIGVPHRVVLGDKGLKEGVAEYQGRADAEATKVPVSDEGACAGTITRFEQSARCDQGAPDARWFENVCDVIVSPLSLPSRQVIAAAMNEGACSQGWRSPWTACMVLAGVLAVACPPAGLVRRSRSLWPTRCAPPCLRLWGAAPPKLVFADQGQQRQQCAPGCRPTENAPAQTQTGGAGSPRVPATRSGTKPSGPAWTLRWCMGLIEVESGFRKYAISHAGARGYMQIMPFWSRTIGDGDASHLCSTCRPTCALAA
jgi:hypothetical protein